MKPKRIENPELLAVVRKLPCLACVSLRERLTPEEWESLYSIGEELHTAIDASDPDHVTTRGAGGDDVAENLIPMCRMHHNERHDQGWRWMLERYSAVAAWMALAGRSDVFERAGLPVPDSCEEKKSDLKPKRRTNPKKKVSKRACKKRSKNG